MLQIDIIHIYRNIYYPNNLRELCYILEIYKMKEVNQSRLIWAIMSWEEYILATLISFFTLKIESKEL